MAAKEKFAEPTYLECGFGELEHKVINIDDMLPLRHLEAFCPRLSTGKKAALVKSIPSAPALLYCPRTFLDMVPWSRKSLAGSARDEALEFIRGRLRQHSREGRARTGRSYRLARPGAEVGRIDCGHCHR